MPSSHDAPPVTLDCPLEVGPDDWRAPGFYQLLTALMVPRPLGWISTILESGVRNVAPYSYFNLMGSDPPYVACVSLLARGCARHHAQPFNLG